MNYEGLYILNIAGKDEGLKEAMDSIEKEISALGGRSKGSQKMDRRKFEHVAGPVDSGFYVNVPFSLPAEKLEALRQKLQLNAVVFRQYYLKKENEPTPVAAEKAEKASR